MPKQQPIIDAVDLFCGGGGLTCGLRQAGINVKAGVEIDPLCKYAYEHNNHAEFRQESVFELKGESLLRHYEDGHIRLLAGCPPCQTFSSYNQKAKHQDPRYRLPNQFLRVITELQPDLVAMENVPLLTKKRIFKKLIEDLEARGYKVDHKIVYCPAYGLPQRRKRVILLASRLGPIKVPEPPKKVKIPTVREMIGDLPQIEAGKSDPNDRLHFCAALSPLNMKRMKASKQGGTWRDWPEELVAACHKKDSGHTYPGVYGRMSWDKPAPTMTTQFYGFGNGRFGHPEQDRAISVREGAVFQGFPKDYQFLPPEANHSISLLGKMIGNAVPVGLGTIIGNALIEHVAQYVNLGED